ncbi:MAG: UDP-N-acetylmuramoyl-tripeptide--D-alanyl-D-alanine ligase [Clostridiales bacterium]|nr:UDP-N-acetylmuramoyl-tripeptide--D-alanyl-D-alanine ligase [Clostridiales bacterium]
MKRFLTGDILQVLKESRLTAGNETKEITGVAADSRLVKPGDLFVAMPGQKVHGNDFIPAALERGCAAVLADRSIPEAEALAEEKGAAFICVEDPLKGMQDLAAWYLSQFSLKKVAVTGSMGKTTTKDMVYYILSEKYKTARSKGNANSQIGLCLSVFGIEEGDEAAVFEMGMEWPGEIHRLAELVRPHVAVITNVGISHIHQLKTRENILKAKMEIADFFTRENTLIINRDNDMLSAADFPGEYRLLSVGETQGAVLITDIQDHGEEGISFVLDKAPEKQSFTLPVPGRHNAHNAALAVLAGLSCGVTMKEAAAGLEKFVSGDKRLNIREHKNMKIIDDTYNAGPDSVRAGLNVLASMKGDRKVAILGDMLGLGDEEKKYHFEIGEYASQKGTDVVISVGNHAKFISDGAASGKEKPCLVMHFDKREDMEAKLPEILREGDVVLVKASRAMALDKTVASILAH